MTARTFTATVGQGIMVPGMDKKHLYGVVAGDYVAVLSAVDAVVVQVAHVTQREITLSEAPLTLLKWDRSTTVEIRALGDPSKNMVDALAYHARRDEAAEIADQISVYARQLSEALEDADFSQARPEALRTLRDEIGAAIRKVRAHREPIDDGSEPDED